MNNKNKYALVAGALALAAMGATAQAQSSDALIDKLVDKGILTTKEANDLREETDKDFSKAYSVKSGLPEWVTGLRLGGDLRLRYDGIYIDADKGGADLSDRNRLRYRLRFGVTATLLDNFEVGLRLTSAENKSSGNNPMGDPISGNDSFTSNGSKKTIWIDQAYAKWNAINSPDWTVAFIGGKMENPFSFSEVVMDPDYTPEGLAFQIGYNVNERHSLKFNTGLFSLVEVSGSSKDSYLFGGQLRWDAKWNQRWASSLGFSGLAFSDKQNLTHTLTSTTFVTGLTTNAVGGVTSIATGTVSSGNPNVPDVSKGNTRVSSTGALTSSFNPIIVDASVTYTMDSFPMYPGAFPIKFLAEYINNPAASVTPATSALGTGKLRNQAYDVGVVLGKSGKKGTWDLTYKWKNLESNYMFEEMVDSDHGAYYQTSPFTGGGGTGYGAGTNIRGHYARAAYSPYDSLTLSVTYYLFNLIDKPPGTLSSQAGRIQIDAAWKF